MPHPFASVSPTAVSDLRFCQAFARRTVVILAVVVALGAGRQSQAGPAANEQGFVKIFNGKDLSGWDGDKRFWSVKDGVIHGETTRDNPAPYNTFLIWRGGVLGDFELRLSFRILSGNSGVQVRSRHLGGWRVKGYQVEVAPPRSKMGLFYEERGRKRLATCGQKVVIRPGGKKEVVASLGDPKKLQSVYKEKDWNDLVVIARGNHLVQKINGVVFSEIIDEDKENAASTGILALQLHAGPPTLVEFKNIRLKALSAAREISLFNGKDLTGWAIPTKYEFQQHGKVYVKDGNIILEEGMPMTGIGWKGDFPKENYEVSLEAMRLTGYDFFCGMTFPVGDSWCTLIVGGWGGTVVGLSNVDDLNASENQTSLGMEFQTKRWYKIRVRVTKESIRAWIDGKQIIDQPRKGHTFGVWEEQAPIKPFGISTWMTGAALRNIKLRVLGD